jgi:hypothetical protein
LLITDAPLTPLQEKRFAGVLKPHQICAMDFELKRGAIIEGVLMDDADQPLRNSFIVLSESLENRDSIFRTSRTDPQGRFTFDGIPAGASWHVQLGAGDQQGARYKSAAIAINSAETYRFLLKKAGSESLELTSVSNSATPGK